MKPLKPYIGITDFMTRDQVRAMLEVFNRTKPKEGSGRVLHVGVMTGYNTLHGNESIFTKAFPKNEAIADIFWSDETFNCLHYADYKEHPKLAASLTKAITLGGTGIHALQLDMIWPAVAEIATAVHTSRKKIEVILQLNTLALSYVENDPNQLVERLEEYNGTIHRVLLDMSMGRGLGMNPIVLLPFARAIKKYFPHLGLVVAGGLGPFSMKLVKTITDEFPDVSIDAQGQLRPSFSCLDPIDWTMAENYIIEAHKRLP